MLYNSRSHIKLVMDDDYYGAGWAVPINSPDREPVHFYKENGHSLCKEQEGMCYTGPKISPDFVPISIVCTECFNQHQAAVEVVGKCPQPENTTIVLGEKGTMHINKELD